MVAFVLLAFAAEPAWRELRTRHTNVDLVAEKLKKLTTEGDLILVRNWESAISLSRYYHGPAMIITLPPIADHRFHRYDLVLRQMMTRDPLQPVFDQLAQTLRAGDRVFLAGALQFPETSQPITGLPPLTQG